MSLLSICTKTLLKILQVSFCSVLLFATAYFYESVSHAATEASSNTIDVSGLCEKKVIPDRGQITFSIIELQKDPSTAAQKLTQRTDKLIEALKKLNLNDSIVSTTGINLNERKEYEKDRYVSRGFEARTSISLQTSEIDKLGKAFSVAGSQNVDNVDSFSTFLSTGKYNTEYNDCLEEAVKNGRQKADRLAKAAGAQVGSVEQISESLQRSEPVIAAYASKIELRSQSLAGDASLPVAVGNQDFKVSVYLRFKVK